MSLFIPNPLIINEDTLRIINKPNFSNKIVRSTSQELYNDSNLLTINNNIEVRYIGPKSNSAIDSSYKILKPFIYFDVDFKTDIFRLKSGFNFENILDPSKKRTYFVNYKIQANNDNKYSLDITKESNKNKNEAVETFYSINLNKIKYSELKTLSVIMKFNEIKMEFAFKFNGFESYKNDLFLQPKFNEFKISLQSGIKVEINYDPILEPIFNNIFLRPIKMEQNKNNKFLMNVMIKNEFEVLRRDLFKPLKISGLPLSVNEKDKFEFQPGFDNVYRDNELVFLENSYYDLKAKKTKIGAGKNSDQGYVIPYNYTENFYPVLDFSLANLKNFKLTWVQKIDMPYFDPDNKKGIVKILINFNNNNNSNVSEWNKIKNSFFDEEENKNITYTEFINKIKNNFILEKD